MTPGDFIPQTVLQAFNQSVGEVAGFFNVAPGLIHQQIFARTALQAPLFRLFIRNSVNRAGGPRLARDWDWDKFLDRFAEFFMDYDASRFAERYPRDDGCPSTSLRNDFATAAVPMGVIGGNVAYHQSALRRAATRNGWVRMLGAAQGAGHLFAELQPAGVTLNAPQMMRALWGFDLTAIPLASLTVQDLWRATDSLIGVPEVGRQLALNFIKDAGYGHAFKPDTHTRKVAGMAFRQNPNEYAANDGGERACVGACLAFAKVLAGHGNWNGWPVSLAAVDRLMWLAGSGNLRVAGIQLPRGNAALQRRTATANILRSAVRPGCFDA